MDTTRALCALLFASTVFAAEIAPEVKSPETFLAETFRWTIKGMDGERGVFGDYPNFACFADPVVGQSFGSEVVTNRRWATLCWTKRSGGENLGAMIFISWLNPKAKKPMQLAEVFEQAALQMAGAERKQGADAICGQPEQREFGGKPVAVYDCKMGLPFGTYYASFVAFSHREIPYVIRVQNASSHPIPGVPNKVARKIASSLVFE